MTPAMGNKERRERTPDEIQRIKAYWISFAITLVVSAGVAVGSFFLFKSNIGDYENNRYRILADTFTIPAVMFLMVYLLVKVSRFGAFDIIVYSVRLLFVVMFRPNMRDSKLPRTYREYREMKQAKPRTSISFLAWTGLAHLIPMIVFVVLYYVSKA